jgi:uncharacterized protein
VTDDSQIKQRNQEELDASEDQSSNPSANRSFGDVLNKHFTRRKITQGSLAGAATAFVAPAAMASWDDDSQKKKKKSKGNLVDFEPVSLEQATADQSLPTISDDYEYQVIIPWGTPIEPGATEAYLGDPDSRPTSDQASKQIGIGHDGMWFFPEDQNDGKRYGAYGYKMSNRKGMLCVNHEFGRNSHVLGKDAPESLEDVRLAQNVMGVSVVALEKDYNSWNVVKSPNSRRITVNTPMDFSGPAAASELLQNAAGNIPLGTINNCGSGPTPWGTYLTCEENFNGYFGATDGNGSPDAGFTPTEEQARYGFANAGFGYGWENFDKRFDLNDPDYVNESNRFGWVVEIDPFDGTQKPVKRTALGRFKHEAIAIAEAKDGRIAAYMGDDQRGDYCYKFVSELPWRDAVAAGKSPLDEGTLYAARFDDDGTGTWLALDVNASDALWQRFGGDQAALLINARIAADIVGATKMDRPEWTTIGKNNSVFWTLTNNNRKDDGQGEVNAANPENPNNNGHIIRTKDGRRGLGTRFKWEIYILASSTIEDPDTAFSAPDAAYADPFGRLFIGTDGGQPLGLQDQVTVFDTKAKDPVPKRLLVGVPSDELTGWATTPNYRTAFVNVQHPGNGSPENTSFPDPFGSNTIPRDATLVITKKDNGVIGS